MAERLDAAHDALRAEPPYDVRRETWWQYTRRLAKAAIEAGSTGTGNQLDVGRDGAQ